MFKTGVRNLLYLADCYFRKIDVKVPNQTYKTPSISDLNWDMRMIQYG